MRQIKDIGFTIEELSVTQGELSEAIDEIARRLGLESCNEVARVKRIVNNKFEFCRSVVQAQNYLERNGHCEVVK